MKPYIERVIKVVVLPDGEPVFSEHATEIEIQDEAGGEFVVVRQVHDGSNGANEIRLTDEEWPMVRAAIDRMMARCQPEATEEKGTTNG